MKFGFLPRFAAERRRETKNYSPINQGACQFEKDAAVVCSGGKGKGRLIFCRFLIRYNLGDFGRKRIAAFPEALGC